MPKNVKFRRMILAGFMCAVFFLNARLLFAQPVSNAELPPSDDVLKTEIGLDQMMVDEKPGPVMPSKPAVQDKVELSPGEQSLMMINQSLKNAIEENKKLIEEKEAVQAELGRIRGDNEVFLNRINILSRQREDLQKRAQEAEKKQQESETKVQDANNIVAQKEKEFNDRLEQSEREDLEQQQKEQEVLGTILPRLKEGGSALEQGRQEELKRKAKAELENLENNAQKMMSQVRSLNRENKKLKTDSAKMHYNIANLFFEQGRYDRAAAEYKKVLAIMPDDPSTHYNLAFVNGEFLKDYKTALEHYQAYLYLSPYADDTALVKEKILEIELILKSNIGSYIEDDLKKKSHTHFTN